MRLRLQQGLAVLFLSWILGACASTSPSVGGQQPLFSLNMNTPDEITRSFLDAWSMGALEAMYALIAPQSQTLYPFSTFEERYLEVSNTLGLERVSYTLRATETQGTSASIGYDITFKTLSFGDITDSNRTLRLIQTPNGWRVAWSPLDIMDGLASDIRLTVQSRLPQRANIYDRNGFAMVQQGGTIRWLAVIKQEINNLDNCISLLSRLMIRNRRDMQRLFDQYNADTWFHVGEIDPDVYSANLADLNAQCAIDNTSAGFRKTGEYTSRRYVGVGAAAHITGYIGNVPADQLDRWQARGYNAGDLVGLMGIENTYNDTLAGKATRILRMTDSGGLVVRELGGAAGADPVPVQLTIDMGLQQVLARAVNDAYNYAGNNWGSIATGTGAIVMNVRTGEILALFSYPTFDPSLFNPNNSYTDPTPFIATLASDRVRSPLSNKVVQEQYTPGSVYKIISTVAAADSKTWSPTELFNCELEWSGRERYGDAPEKRQDWRVVDQLPAAGEITMSQALTTSCNPFFWETGALMFRKDPNLLVKYSEMLGLGRRTGFNAISPEAGGNLAAPTDVTSAINNAIGQGNVQITALQMVRAVSAIANGGTVHQPYIVQQIGGLDGTEVQQTFSLQVVNTLTLDPLVYEVVKNGMCGVTTDERLGTAYSVFSNSPYPSCGKTGTAQAGVPGSGVAPHGWYAAFAPADDPEIAVVIVTTNGREGSETSAPMVRRVFDYYFGAPEAPFPKWWEGEYVPVQEPQGLSG